MRRLLLGIPVKFLLPLAVVFGTVVGLSPVSAHSVQSLGSAAVVEGQGSEGTAARTTTQPAGTAGALDTASR